MTTLNTAAHAPTWSHARAAWIMVLATLMWSIAGVVTRQLQAAQGLAGGVVRRGLGLGAVIDAGGVQALNGQAPLQQLSQVPGQR